jgi:hypothetical protein
MRFIVLTLALLLAGCVSAPKAPLYAKQIWCDTNDPLPPLSNAATAPRAEVDAHNDYQDKGIAWCGWKAQ